jgi:hypothetical protein
MSVPAIVKETREASSGKPGESVEPRQVTTTEDMHPDPSKSIKLPENRQKLVDDVIALYSMEPTVERVSRYAPNCVYGMSFLESFAAVVSVQYTDLMVNADDQFVYANNRYKMAGQWFALPKLFKESKNEGYEIIKNERELIQYACIAAVQFRFVHLSKYLNRFKNEQTWVLGLPFTDIANKSALVSLSLDPATADSDFPTIVS